MKMILIVHACWVCLILGFREYAYFDKIINLVNMKGYIVLCHWRDENDEETEIINNTVYTSKKKAREAMKQTNYQ